MAVLVFGDDDIDLRIFLDCLHKLWNLLRGMLKVVVHSYDEIPFCKRKTAEQSGMLSEIFRHLYNPYPGICIAEFFHDFIGVISGTVIHQNQFKLFVNRSFKYCPDALVQFRERVFRVENRYYNGI